MLLIFNVFVVTTLSSGGVSDTFYFVSKIPPTADEAGHCDVVSVEEVGGTTVVVFRQSKYFFCVLYGGHVLITVVCDYLGCLVQKTKRTVS